MKGNSFRWIKKILKPKTKRYLSCALIEHGFAFDQNNCLRVCTMPNNEGGGRPLIMRGYNGETIDWDKVFKIKQRHRTLQQSGRILPKCVGCPILTEEDWDTDDYISEIIITHWNECNSNCFYCPVINDEKLRESTKYYNILPAIKDAIKKNVIKKNALIELAGGESTIYPEFEELINLLVDNKFSNVVINTSAIQASPAIEKGIKKGSIKIIVSVDAGKKETHEKIKRVKSFDKVWENLRIYSRAQSKTRKKDLVRTKYIIVPGFNDTKEEIDLFLKNNIEANIKATAINVEMDWYEKNKNNENKHIKELVKYAYDETKRMNIICKIYPHAYWILEGIR